MLDELFITQNQNMYMYHSSNINSRETATIITATSMWVKNMSSTDAQKQLLAHGPNFAISPKSSPIGEYITAVEQTCLSLAQGGAEGTACRG